MAILRKTYVGDNGKMIVEEMIVEDLITIKKKDKLRGGDFIFLFQNAILEIVLHANLSRGAHQILLYLMAKTEFEKEINATLYGIAKELGMDQGNAVKAMKELEAINIVIRNKELRTFRLNYEIGFKGSPKNYKKLQFNDPAVLKKPIELSSVQTTILDQPGVED
jgi:hypothetical protein